jgi:hypothetical protein
MNRREGEPLGRDDRAESFAAQSKYTKEQEERIRREKEADERQKSYSKETEKAVKKEKDEGSGGSKKK